MFVKFGNWSDYGDSNKNIFFLNAPGTITVASAGITYTLPESGRTVLCILYINITLYIVQYSVHCTIFKLLLISSINTFNINLILIHLTNDVNILCNIYHEIHIYGRLWLNANTSTERMSHNR